MSKFMIGDRVQINGEPTDWNVGTIEQIKSNFGEDYCTVNWDSSRSGTFEAEALFLVHRPNAGVEPLADWEKALLAPASNLPFAEQVDTILNSIGTLLKAKNEAYGDSALNPIRVFSKADPAEGLRVRIDDKLSRIARGADAGEDTVTDLLGYLVMLKISEGNK